MKKIFTLLLCFILSKSVVNAQCNAAFTYIVGSDGNVTFVVDSSASVNWLNRWDFGDNSSQLPYPYGNIYNWKYNTPGIYRVKHVVTDITSGCTDSIIKTVVVNFVPNNPGSANCNASFTYRVDYDGTVTFFPDSSMYYSSGKSEKWNFGSDPSVMEDVYLYGGQVLSYKYKTPGNYTIVHVVKDTVANCIDSLSQVINVQFTVNCNADFFISTDSSSTIYTFVPHLVYSGSGIRSFLWTVDNIAVSTNEIFSDTLTAGEHQVCLSIVTNAGCSSSICKTVSVHPSQHCNLNVSFTAIAAPDNARKFIFTPSVQDNRMNYNWSFGDSHYSSQMIAQNTYYNQGNYQVTLAIYDTLNYCADTIMKHVIIEPLPSELCAGSFTYTIDHGDATFTAISNQPITHVEWMLTGGNDSIGVLTGQLLNYKFKDTGLYLVCADITTNTGCRRYYCDTVLVNEVSLERPSSTTLPSYPNPAIDKVKVNIILDKEVLIQYKVCNSFGNIVYQSQMKGQTGNNTITIPLQQLIKGQYFIDILYGDKRNKSVFQKL